jgi:hypothetical protein
MPRNWRAGTGVTGLCVREVLRRGKASVDEVLGAVGAAIPAAQAVSRARACLAYKASRPAEDNGPRERNPDSGLYTEEFMAGWGRRLIVTSALQLAVKKGRLRRLSPGVYAPPAGPQRGGQAG